MSLTVLVVGASGFVGQALVLDLLRRGYKVHAAARSRVNLPDQAFFVKLPDLTGRSLDWADMVIGVDHIIFLAARVHVMNDTHPDPLAAYRAVNRDAALSLARLAATQGVRRFVYLSSIKVNGETSDRPLLESDIPKPTDPYGISKYEAESELLHLKQVTKLGIVILRPPLVYGPGVKANFMALAKAAGRGIPLPIGAIKNKRSMVYIENLTDLIITSLEHPNAAGEIFFASDGEDLSTPDITKLLAEAQGKSAWLPALPVFILIFLGKLSGNDAMIKRLTGSLQVSSAKVRKALDWIPPYPVWLAMQKTGMSVQHIDTWLVDKHSKVNLTRNQSIYLGVRTIIEKLLAIVLLFLLAPFLLIIAAVISLDSPGSVFFIQKRAGRHHRPFRIYKFRTMYKDTPSVSTEDMQKAGLSPITRSGKVLRRTSLDELPQLLNVLQGNMSFIGPRPALMTQTRVLTLREAAGVEQLLPGITGYAQVTGRDDLEDEEKVRRDAEYLRRVNFGMDLSIVKATLESVVKGTGNK